MKKTAVLILLFTFIAYFCYGQKIQIKKGLILIDKEPVAQLEGKATLLKGTHLIISSLEGVQLINLEETNFKTASQYQEEMYFYNLSFAGIDKQVCHILDRQYTSEKNIVENLYKEIGSGFLTKEGLNQEIVNSWIENNDHTQQIHRDTTFIGELVLKGMEALKEPLMRDPDQLYKTSHYYGELLSYGRELWRNVEPKEKKLVLGIYQDDNLLGVIVKILKSPYESAEIYTSARYYVLRRVKPFKVQGKEIRFVDIASLTASETNQAKINIMDQEPFIESINNFEKAERHLVNLLISKGYL